MNPQVIRRALTDINDAFAPLIMETNFCETDEAYSWPGYVPGIPNSLAYAAEYQRLIDRKQFSFLLMDKSFFQFYFKFDIESISNARLAYYPPPLKISGAIDDIVEVAEMSGLDLLEELYLGAESWIDRGIDIVNTSHIRLDYDSEVTAHCPCHIQFGGVNEFRIPSFSLINPFIFFEWVCENMGVSQLPRVMQRMAYQRSIGYHLSRSQQIGEVEGKYPHIISGG